MKTKLAEPWWDELINPITGLPISKRDNRVVSSSKYDATDYGMINYINSKDV